MRRFCLITILMVICVAGLWLPRDGRHPGTRMVSALPRRTHLQATDSPVREERVRYVRDVSVDPIDEARAIFSYQQAAVMEAERQVGEFITWYESIPIPTPVRQAPGNQTGILARPTSGGGSLSRASLVALARCESGTDISNDYEARGGYRTGLFGIEAGYAMGYMSQAEQIAWVERIYAQYGSSAWGCSAAFG